MWATMEHTDSVFMNTNEEGIERVKQSNRGYAYFMESSTIEYIIQTECNLTRVGGWLDSKAYGIGMPMSMIKYAIIFLVVVVNRLKCRFFWYFYRFSISR